MTVKRRRRRRLNFQKLSAFLFFVSVIASISSSLFLQAYNNDLSTQIHSTKIAIANATETNDSLTLAIQGLSSKDRVLDIAGEAGLVLDGSNIVSYVNEE